LLLPTVATHVWSTFLTISEGWHMQVKAEGIEAQLGNTGITLRISDNSGKAVGRLQIGKAKLVWSPGKVSKNVTRIPIEDFIDWMNSR
jgi:hypothetical protein